MRSFGIVPAVDRQVFDLLAYNCSAQRVGRRLHLWQTLAFHHNLLVHRSGLERRVHAPVARDVNRDPGRHGLLKSAQFDSHRIRTNGQFGNQVSAIGGRVRERSTPVSTLCDGYLRVQDCCAACVGHSAENCPAKSLR